MVDQEREQQEYFEQLAKLTTESLALFYCCIKYDVPFDLNAVPEYGAAEWTRYLDNLRIKKLDINRRTKVKLGFLDGLTDITRIFGENLEKGEFSRAVDVEKSARDIKAGTNKQRAEWGGAGKYSNEDYKYLDAKYETLSKRPKESGNFDEQTDLTLHTICTMYLKMDKATAADQPDKAKKWADTISKMLENESLRKKDEKPIANVRIDNFIDALEKNGLLDKGAKIPSCDELMERIYKFAGRKKYPYTIDAAEHALKFIRNCGAKNDGYEETPDVTSEMRMTEHAGEFADEPNADEKKVYAELGLMRKGEKKRGRRETQEQ